MAENRQQQVPSTQLIMFGFFPELAAQAYIWYRLQTEWQSLVGMM